MCGISAIVYRKVNPPAGTIERMTARLAHRGPDAGGVKILPGCHLGHARLSVIDLETGAQPMTDTGGRYWTTFNGEIYNYRELRRELEAKGYCFVTRSDTEVVLLAYVAWGRDCLDRFRGMFAFALWDTLERRLFAARDPFGEKPLYFATALDDSLLLASEIKAIIAAGILAPRLDRGSVDAFLMLGYIPPDRTIFENVSVVPPGHYLEWRDGRVDISRHWTPRFDTKKIALEDAGERLRELLAQAVRRQMVSDVPVGAFLSGGLDSSTIVAVMQQQSLRPVKTFSVGFGDRINELPYARAVADLYRTEHHEVELGSPPVAGLLEQMADVYDEPFSDSSGIPTYLLCEFARRHVKVVLSGDGGDELFGGYWWYPVLAMSEKVPRSLTAWVILRIASGLFGRRLALLNLYADAIGLAARRDDMWSRDVMVQTFFKEPERRKLWGKCSAEVPLFSPGEYYRPAEGASGLNACFSFDIAAFLPGDILVKVDRAAMAHGLEVRVPFLDRDLAEFALSLPARLKVDRDRTKILLRDACGRYWPPALHTRGKQGFGAPCIEWLGQKDMQALALRVFAIGSPLRRLLPGVKKEQASDLSYRTWILLTLGLWLERNGAAG